MRAHHPSPCPSPSALFDHEADDHDALVQEADVQEALVQDAEDHEALDQEAELHEALVHEADVHEAVSQLGFDFAVLIQPTLSKTGSGPPDGSDMRNWSRAAFGFGGLAPVG